MATTSTHRALADERRARIVDELGAAPGGLDVRALADRLGLHQNTVRWHLGVLADAGLVVSAAAERSRPGRPRILYRLSPGAVPEGRDEHRLLATILTGTIAGLEDGPARAEAAGRAWGRYLVPRPLPLARTTPEDATREVVGLLDQQGFAPVLGEDGIEMRRCPFHELAETNPEIVCAVHRGLIAGALEELGAGVEVERLDVFARPDLCVARLRRLER